MREDLEHANRKRLRSANKWPSSSQGRTADFIAPSFRRIFLQISLPRLLKRCCQQPLSRQTRGTAAEAGEPGDPPAVADNGFFRLPAASAVRSFRSPSHNCLSLVSQVKDRYRPQQHRRRRSPRRGLPGGIGSAARSSAVSKSPYRLCGTTATRPPKGNRKASGSDFTSTERLLDLLAVGRR